MSEESLFAAALEIELAGDREAFLDEACAGDVALRGRVGRLLAAHEKAFGILDAPATPPGAFEDSRPPPDDDLSDTSVGPLVAGRYKLLVPIGEGGMGTVWLAEQTHPVRRKVAVKLVRAGMGSRSVVARFEAERQALALMDHPHIAKVLDGGATENGRPFFVMEYVEGLPITQHCDDARLGIRGRLELFVQVCQAVQHAHTKGIIHRDLKPSNVLVALYDGAPVPKVIDFGVAKATGPKPQGWTTLTKHGQLVGTPLYMSPEQAEMGGVDVDTRSDVYALGVLLYELLTGSTPFEAKGPGELTFFEVLRIIRETEPPTPSRRLATSEELPSIAARRGTEPTRLGRLVQGELDWIVMKALEKDRDRRYETASALARDLERYLADEPVEACPPSAGYRLRKLVGKHRAVLATAAMIAGLLVAAAAISTWQAVRATRAEEEAKVQRDAALAAKERARQSEELARRERDRAEASFRQARDAVRDLFTTVAAGDLAERPGMQPLQRKLLGLAREYYEGFLRQRPDDPNLAAEAAATYFRLGNVTTAIASKTEAARLFRRALDLLEGLARDHPADLDYAYNIARTYLMIADHEWSVGHRDEAFRRYDQALTIAKEIVRKKPDVAEYLECLARSADSLGVRRRQDGDPRGALEHHREAQAIASILVERYPDNADYANALANTSYNAAQAERALGRLDDALGHFEQARLIRERLVQERPRSAEYRLVLAVTHASIGATQLEARRDRAAVLRAYESARDVLEKVVAENPDVSNYADSLADIYFDISRVERGRDRADRRIDALLKARAIQARLTELHPGVYRYPLSLLGTSLELISAMEERAEGAAVQTHLNDAGRVAESLLQTPPRSERHRKILADALGRLAAADARSRDFPAAIRWQKAALDLTDNEADRRARLSVLGRYETGRQSE
jgi:eukaryotic-like serine/threonine-protein kinase